MPHIRPLSWRRIVLVACFLAAAIAAVAIAVASGWSGEKGAVHAAIPKQLRDPTTLGQIAFVSDFEREGLPEWYVQALPGRVRLTDSHSYEGRGAAHFEVRPGDVEPDTGSPRAEVSGPYFHEGRDLYVRTAFRVPRSYSYRGAWQLIQQFHETYWNGSPGTAVFLNSNRRISLGHGDSSQIDWYGPRLRPERWYELVYRVMLSRNPRVGFVEVWLDGRHQKLNNHRYREYGWTMQRPTVYLKSGIYRAPGSTGISMIEDDSILVIERLDSDTDN
jgi:Polysaccharide lyase